MELRIWSPQHWEHYETQEKNCYIYYHLFLAKTLCKHLFQGHSKNQMYDTSANPGTCRPFHHYQCISILGEVAGGYQRLASEIRHWVKWSFSDWRPNIEEAAVISAWRFSRCWCCYLVWNGSRVRHLHRLDLRHLVGSRSMGQFFLRKNPRPWT